MKEKDYLALLAKREIQPTAIRILVLQAMLKAGRSVSYSIWKICWIRLTNPLSSAPSPFSFLHHLIHSIDDGTGSFKYAVCSASCSCEVNDLHHSFSLRELQQDILLPEYPTPVVQVSGRIYAEQHQLCTERALSGMCGKR